MFQVARFLPVPVDSILSHIEPYRVLGISLVS